MDSQSPGLAYHANSRYVSDNYRFHLYIHHKVACWYSPKKCRKENFRTTLHNKKYNFLSGIFQYDNQRKNPHQYDL